MAEVVREATAAYLEREARTIALPGDVAARLDALAAAQGTSSEHLAARLLRQTLGEQPPRPRVPLTEEGWGGGDDAERVDELLAGGFGTEA